LGVPFGGPRNGRDTDGQFFSKNTDIHHDFYPEIPVFYYHGYTPDGEPQGEPVIIGKAVYNKQDDKGHWYKVVLDKTKDFAKSVWEAAKSGIAKASSGSVMHLIREGDFGEILNWPTVEMTLTDGSKGVLTAANAYAVALPAAKATFTKAGLNLVIPPEKGDNNSAIKSNAEAGEARSGDAAHKTQGAKMEFTKEELQQMLKDSAAEAVKTFRAAEPAPDTAGHVEVVTDEADRPFKSLAEQAYAVKMATNSNGQNIDPRLKRLGGGVKAAQGANESIPADAGYLVEPTIGTELITPIHETGVFSGQVTRMPVGANSNFGYINGVDETSRATGSRWGGVRGYRLAEAATITSSRPKFRRINWELKKYAVLMYATDELILDAAQFNVVARQSAGEELAFMVNDDICNGQGMAGPLGILNAGCLISVGRYTASSILHVDILNMWKRVLPRSKAKAEWYVNPESAAQLNQLYYAGTTSVLSPYVGYRPDGVMTLMGKPVHETEFNPGLGLAGDLLVADLSEYLFWDKGEVQEATSIHIAFLTDEQAFRFIYRCDGQTTYASVITPYQTNASATYSSFVTLSAATG
jgi:HK97 family phage major capsid protein